MARQYNIDLVLGQGDCILVVCNDEEVATIKGGDVREKAVAYAYGLGQGLLYAAKRSKKKVTIVYGGHDDSVYGEFFPREITQG